MGFRIGTVKVVRYGGTFPPTVPDKAC